MRGSTPPAQPPQAPLAAQSTARGPSQCADRAPPPPAVPLPVHRRYARMRKRMSPLLWAGVSFFAVSLSQHLMMVGISLPLLVSPTRTPSARTRLVTRDS